MKTHVCTVCGSPLKAIGKAYSIDQLFELWCPTKFSEAVIEEHRLQAEETQLYRCAECLLETFLPQIIGVPSFYQELAEPVGDDVHGAGYYEDVKWDFIEAQKEVKCCESIIELGCGPGQFLDLSRSEKRRVVGAEYNKSAIEAAKNKGLEVYLVGTLPDELHNSFDGAFSFHVLEHVSSPMDFLGDLASYVKPGGLIGVSVPNQGGPIRFIEPCAMNMPPHHASRWSELTFRYAAKKLGLQVEKTAFEPLLLSNHGYYSKYWIEHLSKKRGFFVKSLLKGLSYCLKIFFRVILLLGFRHFPLLRGQAIYMVFKK